MRTRVTELFGIEYPIFAFSHCRDVVAAVSRAGGMGVLGALHFTPEELELELAWIDEHVGGRPYGVDVVMPAKYEGADMGDAEELLARLQVMIPAEHKRFLEDMLAEHGVEPPTEQAGRALLGWTDVTARPQVEVALKHPIALLANALGPPPADVVEQAHRHGVKVAGLASNARHARKQVDVGVDIIVAQGTEAGGHTGDVATMVLIPEVVDAVGEDTIVLAETAAASASSRASGVAACSSALSLLRWSSGTIAAASPPRWMTSYSSVTGASGVAPVGSALMVAYSRFALLFGGHEVAPRRRTYQRSRRSVVGR